jgi:hypothetical protein
MLLGLPDPDPLQIRIRIRSKMSWIPNTGPCTDLPVEEVLPDGSGRALGGRVPTQVLQLLVNPFQRHLYRYSFVNLQTSLNLFISGSQWCTGIKRIYSLITALRIRDVYPGSEFFPSRIHIKEFKYFNPKKWFLSSWKCDPGCSSRIRTGIQILTFYPFWIPDPWVKKAPDPGSGSATLLTRWIPLL